MRKGRATSIFLQHTNPLTGIWIAPRFYECISRTQRWFVADDGLHWEPQPPPDAHLREETIRKLVELDRKEQAQDGKPFLKLSGTTKTGITWSLPPVAACPIVDETCGGCYALDGWYRTNLAAQYGRVKRLEYLRHLIRERRLATWVDWISNQINRLRPIEPFPPDVLSTSLRKHVESLRLSGAIAFFRWHDSGDLFHADYAKAVLQVCERTPRVFHWMPTRMGPLLSQLVQQGLVVPRNLTIQVSAHRAGRNEPAQLEAVRQIQAAQPDARVGVTYVFKGPRSRKVDMAELRHEFGPTASLCPATVAEKSEDRVCNGCRRCWAAASITSPIIYAVHHGN
jgi:hypothetical protein